MKNLYSKKFKTLDQQVELLEERGLNFKDKALASRMLLEKNYFDVINGFETLLLKDSKTVEKEYATGVYFEHFISLYNFDKSLNSTVLKAIDVFETRLKSSIAYRFSESIFGNNISTDPASYMNILMYNNPYSIHKRIDNLKKVTVPIVESMNRDINLINDEVGRLNNLISKYNTYNIEYINKNMRKILIRNLNKCNESITATRNVIDSANLKISGISAVRSSGATVKPIKNIQLTDIRPNLVTISSKSTNPNSIQENIEKISREFKDLKVRLDKVYSQVAANDNSAINNVAHKELKNFSNHNIFKTNHMVNKNYIEASKIRYNYLKTYEVPPFWVIIKTLELGSILKLMYGLKNDILDKVVEDMGLHLSEKNILFNSIQIIIDLRNHCAHFSLINRYRTKQNIRINKRLINKLNLKTKSCGSTYYEIRLYDTLQVLSQFEDLNEISALFAEIFNNPENNISPDLLNKLLNRMGNDSYKEWCTF